MTMDEVDRIREMSDAVEGARAASDAITRHQEVIADLAKVRRGFLDKMVVGGMTNGQIAAALDMTSPRVSQLLATSAAEELGARPERGFLCGGDRLSIAVGGKWEGQKPTPGAPSPVASVPAMEAIDAIRKLASDLGVETSYKVIQPPGLVQLNQSDLLVLSSPRLLPVVGQPLESDPSYGFASDARGWFLIDKKTGIEYRSPSEKGDTTDYAYLGRLPRPDKRGSFLYLAGIHALGTLGAAHYLVNNLPDLWKKARSRKFSMLLACHYSLATNEITEVVPLTPLQRHGSR